MPVELSPSVGFREDVDATHNFRVIVLHRFHDGALLLMECDGEIPTDRNGLDATGYVFRIAEQDVKGLLSSEGTNFSILDIYDYVLWMDDAAVEAKYREVMAKAHAEDVRH